MKAIKEKNIIKIKRYKSPCGILMLGSFGDKLCLCDWQVEKHRDHVDRRLKRILRAEFEEGISEVIEKAERQLDEFFAGERKAFDVPLLFVGTDFQKKVWNFLLSIPFGKTISYGEMARQIGLPKAVRAVANANGANSISVFAPCHRVIGSDSSLTGATEVDWMQTVIIGIGGCSVNGIDMTPIPISRYFTGIIIFRYCRFRTKDIILHPKNKCK